MGRARALGIAATMTATGLAGPVFAWGGYDAVGAASVLTCLAAAVVATRFPEHRPSFAGGESWTATLRAGLAEARTDRSVRGALLLVVAVTAVWGALDEYTPLLALDTGVAPGTVPWLLLVIRAGATGGSLLAGAAERLPAGGFAVLLTGSALALAVGALAGTPAALVLVALAFGGFQLATVLADVRLQRRIDDSGRATLTSVAGLGTELGNLATYGAYAAVATHTGHGTAFALSAVPYLLTALLLAGAARGAVRATSAVRGGRRRRGRRSRGGRQAGRTRRSAGWGATSGGQGGCDGGGVGRVYGPERKAGAQDGVQGG